MKICKFCISTFFISAILASCGGSSNSVTSTVINAATNNAILGTWQHENSATDDNKNNKLEPTEWLDTITQAQRNIALKEIDMTMDDMDIHFKANGTGYATTVDNDSTSFVWQTMPTANHYVVIDNIDKAKSEFYIDDAGKLIFYSGGEFASATEKTQMHTWAMYHKK
jgi:hypothetical protein